MTQEPSDLAKYRWQNRLLLVFAPSPENEEVGVQQQLLEDKEAELQDRDVLVFYLFPDGGRLADEPLSDEKVTSLRKRYGVAEDDFTVILVGKDGTAKERLEGSMEPADLFGTIDAMPMRQREMRGE